MIDRTINMKSNEGAPDAWCPLPWSHVSIKANGTFRVCCHSAASESRGTLVDENKTPLTIQESSFEQVLNNDAMKLIRKQMLNNEWPEQCVRCQREFDSGMLSRNHYERSALADIIEHEKYPSYQKAKELTKADGSIDNNYFPVNYIDIRFGNLCNLKCVMCSPTDSDQWYDDYAAIWNTPYFWDSKKKINLVPNINGKLKPTAKTFEWSDDANLWSEIEKHMLQFRKIYLVGGEPLLIDAHYEFLQKCVDSGCASKLTIEYNTNLTNIPVRAWDIWKHFETVIIGASIDGFGDVNDLIRFPSKWHKIEENLKKFKNADGNFIVHIATTVQLLNAWQFPEFIEYVLTSNYMPKTFWSSSPLMVSVHPVHRPTYLNLNILPHEFKETLITRYKEYQHKFKTTDYQALYGDSDGPNWIDKVNQACKFLDIYIQFMNKIEYSEKDLLRARQDCIHFLDTLDARRNTDWKSICPELYQATLAWRDLPKLDYA